MRYQVVELKNPGLNIDDKKVSCFLSELLKLKISSYQYEYGQCVMPVNSYDLLSDCIILCQKKTNEALIPVAMFESTRLSICNLFNLSFPPLDIARTGGNSRLANRIDEILIECQSKGQDIRYDSSWTVSPPYREQSMITSVLRVVLSTWVNLHIDSDINSFIVSATLKVGTDKIFRNAGCLPITQDPYYKLRAIDNQDAMMFICHEFSDTMKKLASMHRTLWDDRIVYGK